MSCCGGSKSKQRPTRQVTSGYRTIEELAVTWVGKEKKLSVTGCFTGNRYIFLSGFAKQIDINDAKCLTNLRGFTINAV